MPRSALSPEQIDDFRQRLVSSATRLFAQRGYDGVTLRAIASELGCSPMTPYRYFRDKAAIFAAVRTAAYGSFADTQQACCDADLSPLEVLAALGRAYIRFAIDNSDAYRLMFELGQPDPDGFPELRAAELRSWTPLRDWMQRAVEAGLIEGDPDVLAHVFWSGVHGIASLQLAGKLVFGCGVEDVFEPVLRTLLMGNRGAATDPSPADGGIT